MKQISSTIDDKSSTDGRSTFSCKKTDPFIKSKSSLLKDQKLRNSKPNKKKYKGSF